MKRRDFVKNGAMGGLALSYPIEIGIRQPKKYKLGYQLYSIRDRMATDPLNTLKSLKSYGYQDFEIYGYDPASDRVYGFAPQELKQILEDLDLTVSSGHYGFSEYLMGPMSELASFVDKCISTATILNSRYITWPWLAPELRTIENIKLMAEKLNIIGEQVTKAGLGFAYHNHGFEFEQHNGTSGYDIILNETDSDLVKLQLDMYWLIHSSGLSPKDIVRDQPGRVVMWHIKDMDKVTRDYTELGNGSINYLEELPDPEESGLDYLYIEQGGNYAIDSLHSAHQSAEYYKENLAERL